MDPNAVHRQFLPGYPDPTGWSSILYSYGGQGPATSQLHDLRAEQQRAISESQRQQISGHEIAEFFARTAVGQPPNNILNDCHLQPQPPPQQVETSTQHNVVLDLGLNACVTTKKSDKGEFSFIQDAIERSKFDKRRLKSLKTSLKAWYKRTGCVTVALTCLDGQVHVSGPDHMMSLSGNQDFKNIFMNTLTSYDQLSRLADIVSNCNEGDNVADAIDPGPVQTEEIDTGEVIDGIGEGIEEFTHVNQRQPKKKGLAVTEGAKLDQFCKFCPEKFSSKHFLKKHMFEAHNTSTERLTCPFCNKLFMSRWKLERHTISHTGAKPYNCIYCPKRFAEKNKLICHVKSHKETFVDAQAVERLISSLLPKRKSTHECAVCNKTFLSSWKLKRHNRVHSGEKPFKCLKCPKAFSEKSKLDLHMQLPHGEYRDGTAEKRHSCDKCDKKFISLWKLRRHELFHTGERPFQCDQCEKGFVEKNKLKMHVKYFHCDKNSPDFIPRKINRLKKYECTDCDKKFATHWKLRRHSQTHSTDRPFRCTNCKRGFLTKNKLDLHNFTFHYHQAGTDNEQAAADHKQGDEMINVKTSEANESTNRDSSNVTKPDELQVRSQQEALLLPGMITQALSASEEVTQADGKASMALVSQANAESNTVLTVTDTSLIASTITNPLPNNQNVKTETPKKRSHKCEFCGKEFATPFRLKRHASIHTNKKSYSCTVCSKDFNSKEDLMTHVVDHDGAEGAQPIPEIQSKDETVNGSNTGRHICEYCEKPFVSPWKLKRHITVHTGQKPYYCKICDKAFTEKNKLESHFKLTHSSETPVVIEEIDQGEITMAGESSSFNILSRTTIPLQTYNKETDFGANENPANSLTDSPAVLIGHGCPVCNEVFSTANELDSHVQLLHDEKAMVKSLIEVTEADSGDSKKALKYVCAVCNKGFITPSKLKRHGFSHGEQKPFKCSKCNKRFSENNKLFNHLMTHDKIRSPRTGTKKRAKMEDAAGPVQSIPVTGQPLKTRTLPMPTIITSSITSIEQAISVSSQVSGVTTVSLQSGNLAAANDNNSVQITKESLEALSHSQLMITPDDVSKSNSEQFKSLVDKALSNVNFAEVGSKSAGGIIQVANVEQERTSSNTDAEGEQLLHPFSADKGVMVDIQPTKNIQDNQKHWCLECNKGFATPSSLKRHAVTHSNEKPFECHLCTKSFKRKDSLVKHIEEHHHKASEVQQ